MIGRLRDAGGAVWRRSRRAVVFVVGMLILLLAAIAFPLPGPFGVLIAVPGLMLLATEFEWARRWLEFIKRHARVLRDRAQRIVNGKPRPLPAEPVPTVQAPRPLASTHDNPAP